MLQGRRRALLFLYFILLSVLGQTFIDVARPVYADLRDPRVPPAQSAPRIETDMMLPPGRIEPGARVTLGLTVSNERGSDAEGYSHEVSLTDGLTLARGGGFLSGSVPRLAAQGVYDFTLDVDVAATVVETQYAVLKVFDEEGNLQDSGVIALSSENEEESTPPALPRPWMPGGIEPYTSLFSGAATYNYPLEAPPGRGGIQPELAVVYNSRATDATVAWRDSSEWGEGWALAGLPYIYVQNIHVCGHPDANDLLCAGNGDGSDGNGYTGHKRYMLSFGGQSYRIDNDSGSLRVTDAPELRITNLFPPTQEWTLETTDGLIYHFGTTAATQQMMAPVSNTTGGTDIGKWLLEYVEDSYGNRMGVQYVFKKAQEGSSGCVNHGSTCRDISAYPRYIRYNARTGDPQISDPADWDSEVAFAWSDLVHSVGLTPIFKTTALSQSVTMSHRGTTGMKTVWSYHFATAEVPSDCAICEIHQLDSIYRKEGVSTSDANWPAAEFFYDIREMGEWPPENYCTPTINCEPDPGYEVFSYPILELVKNGYGAVYEFTYAQWGINSHEYGYTSWTVSELQVWDGYEREYEVSDPPTLHYLNAYSGICYAEGSCNDGLDGEEYGVVGYQVTTRQTQEGESNHLATDVFEFDTGHPLLNGRQKTHSRYFDEAAQTPYSITTWVYDPRLSGGSEGSGDDPDGPCSRYGIPSPTGYDMVCLFSVTEELYEQDGSGSGSELVSGKQEQFRYEPNRQGDMQSEWRQRGQLTRHDYRYLSGLGAYVNYLVDTYEYQAADWLVGLWKETHYQVIDNVGIPDEWIAQRRTFSLYDDELYPNDGMTDGHLREIRAQASDNLDGGSAILLDTIDTRFAYDGYGNVTEVARFAGYGNVRWDGEGWDTVYAAGNGSAAYTTTLTYDDVLHLLVEEVSDPQGNVTTFGYGGTVGGVQPPNALLLSSVHRPTGLTTNYEYDAWGRLRAEYGPEVIYPDKSLDYLLPDLGALGMPIAVTVESYPEEGASVSEANKALYDGLGRVVRRQRLGVTDEVAGGQIDVTTLYELDGLGRVTCESAPLKTIGSNPQCANQAHVVTSYDVVGRVVTSTIAVDGAEEQVFYIGNEMDGWVEDVGHELGGVFQVATRVRDDTAGITHRRTVKTYDAIGRLAWVGQYERVPTSVCSQGVRYLITSYEYDYDGRPASIKRGASLCMDRNGDFILKHSNRVVETTIAYDPQGRKTELDDPDMGLWKYTYHPDNNVKRQVGAFGTADETTTCAAYDSLGRLTDRWRRDTPTASCNNIPLYNQTPSYAHYTYYSEQGSASLGQLEQIDYNVHMSGLSDPFFRDTFTYDGLGRPATVTREIDGQEFTNEVLSYDVLGRPLEVVNAAGITVTTSYDDWGGDQLAAELDGTPTTLVSEVTVNHRGQMSEMARGNGVVTEYDYFGPAGGYRLDSVDVNAASGGGYVARFDYAYDYVGQIVTAMTEIGGVDSTESFAYDTLGRLDTAGTDAGDPQAYDYDYVYDTLSNLIAAQSESNPSAEYDMGAPGGNQPHAVKEMETSGQGSPYAFTYDALGQMTGRESAAGNFEQAFDALGRLTSVVRDGEAATYFAYDPDGNRVLEIRPDGRTTFYPFPDYELEATSWPRTQVVLQPVEVAPSETFTVTWAAYGALLSDCSFSGDWPATPTSTNGNQQAEETEAGSYDYALSCSNEYGTSVVTRTLTVSNEPEHSTSPPAAPIVMTTIMQRTTYGLDGSTVALHREGQLTPGGPYIEELYYMHGNHLGSMTLLTDEAGDVVEQARYYPFGDYRLSPTAPFTNTEGITDIGFTGHRQDNLGWENTGLIYMGARYYDPLLRRFISADTIVADGENSLAYNRYAYVYNNPVNMVDPTGHCAMADDACRRLADQLYEKYGWRIEGVWTIEQMRIFLAAGKSILNWFVRNGGGDALARMRAFFGGTIFSPAEIDVVDQLILRGQGVHHVRGNLLSGSTVFLRAGFTLDDVIHELAHVLDNRLGFRFPIGSALLGGGPADDMSRFLGANPSNCRNRSRCAGYRTPKEPIDPNSYAAEGPSEDFAEAFKQSVLNGKDFQQTNPLRAAFMNQLAASAVLPIPIIPPRPVPEPPTIPMVTPLRTPSP